MAEHTRLMDALAGFIRLRVDDGSGPELVLGSARRPFGGARRGGWAGAGGSCAERHNAARLPELDYFCRKLASALNDGECPQHWHLPYAKAGAAAALPDAFASESAYLDVMQSAAALEFQASIRQALEQAQREERRSGVSGFHEFVPLRGRRGGGGRLEESESHGTWVALSGVDFEKDSWGRHLVQVKETESFHLAIMAKLDDETQEHVMALLPKVEHSGSTRMRTLGFVGPFLAQYEAAQELRYQLQGSTLPSPTRQLLAAVVCPSALRRSGASSTLRLPGSRLRTEEVPVNVSQRAAVEGLRGGLDLIHGPPGTGKSTTIFHLIDARVQRDAQALVTCTRNSAVDSVVDKVARLEGGILVFGNVQRLGERAAQHTLEARVEGHPAVAAWLAGLAELRAVEQRLEVGSLRHASAEQRVAGVVNVLRSLLDQAQAAEPAVPDHEDRLKSLWADLDERLYLYEEEHAYDECTALAELARVVEDAVHTAGAALAGLRAAVKRQLLEGTRVFVCTIDATARMVTELQEHAVRLSLDTVVVDEAGCVPESATPMLLRLHPANLVLIGDHKQLQAFTALVDPPRNHCRSGRMLGSGWASAAGMRGSLMERAVDAGMPAAMLAEQFRMHPDICAAISSTFYGGKLRTGAGIAARRPATTACRLLDVSGREEQHAGAGFSNRQEAEALIEAAVAAARELEGLGVVQAGRTPKLYIVCLYNRQRNLVLDLLRDRRGWARLKPWDVAVLSADACQGSEADLVLVSTVRNVAAASTSGAALSKFFNDARRINVALSRARHLSILVGSSATMRRAAQREPFWGSILRHYREV